jgi:transposase
MEIKEHARLLNERATKGTSYRKLAEKYQISSSTIFRMIKQAAKQEKEVALKARAEESESMPDDVASLKKELRSIRLKMELQDLMIDIASKELGVDLRKKHGTRQSK